MNKKRFSPIAVCLFSLSLAGCFALSHPDEVAFLQGLAESQNRMQADVTEQGRLFSKLASDVKNNRLKSGTPESKVLSLYGEPNFCRPATGDQIKELCVYRRPAQNFPTDLAYLYFDENKNLSGWQLVPEKR